MQFDIFLVSSLGAPQNHISLKYRCHNKKSNWIRAIYLTYLTYWFSEFVSYWGQQHGGEGKSSKLDNLMYVVQFKLIVLWNEHQLNLLSEVASKSTCHNCQQVVNHQKFAQNAYVNKLTSDMNHYFVTKDYFTSKEVVYYQNSTISKVFLTPLTFLTVGSNWKLSHPMSNCESQSSSFPVSKSQSWCEHY